MSTKNKTKRAAEISTPTEESPLLEGAIPMELEESLIEYSPLNYRKFYEHKDLVAFGNHLRKHGFTSSIIVRPIADGKFELVVGERRLKASRIAGIKTLPARCKELTDSEVRKLQLGENIQRVNPHPMEEAQSISLLLAEGNSIQEAALWLGKPDVWIYGRKKLLSLIPDFQELFLANRVAMKEVLYIAELSEDSQIDFFRNYCKDWKEIDGFMLSGIANRLRNYIYKLNKAPFDTENKELVPSAGACSTCPSNTGTNSLFPDEASDPTCTNKTCFEQKCKAGFAISIAAVFVEGLPDGIILDGNLSDYMEEALTLFPGAIELPQFRKWDIRILEEPEMPNRDDYNSEEYEDSDIDELFAQEMEEYEQNFATYQSDIANGSHKKGVLIQEGKVSTVYFTTGYSYRSQSDKKVLRAKDVAIAIANGTDNINMLNGEKDRLESREVRSEELDKEKIQANVHAVFIKEFSNVLDSTDEVNMAEVKATRYLIYMGLNWETQKLVCDKLFKGSAKNIHDKLAKLTNAELKYFIRMAVASKPDCKRPKEVIAEILLDVASESGLDVKAIQTAQKKIATERKKKLKVRLQELDKRIAIKENPPVLGDKISEEKPVEEPTWPTTKTE